MKVFLTLFLLIGIAFSLQFYLDNTEESYLESFTTLTAPITTAILILLIYFVSPQKTQYRKIIRIIINGILAVLLLLILVSIGIQTYNYKADERFIWGSGVLSSKGNVIQVSSCYFHHAKFWNHDVDKEMIIDDGWNDINYTEFRNNAFYPDSLSIQWFSYVERKFYEGKFALPYKIILAKAKQLRTITNKHEDNYERANPNKIAIRFLAEIMTNGKLAVWISNDYKKLKIGNYQAKAVDKTWHVFDDGDEIDSTSTIDISSKVALVMERCPYRTEIKLPSGFYLKDVDFTFFNQKYWHLKNDELEKIPIFNEIPDCLRLSWSNDKKEFLYQFNFKEHDILNAFRKLKTLQNPNPLLLELKINNTNDSVVVRLKNNKDSLKILSSYMDIYPIVIGSN